LNPTSEARLALVYPKLKDKAYEMGLLLANKGIDIEIAQGLRTWAEQAALYALGRTAPGSIVTKAKPEQSWHTFGCAFDIAIVTSYGLDWTGSSPAWEASIEAGKLVGLASGSEWRTFPDKPHFQLTGRFPATPDDEVLYLFKNGGLEAVWNEIDKSLGGS
jgi:peptidoglycan LD-endopeptidase CwlK